MFYVLGISKVHMLRMRDRHMNGVPRKPVRLSVSPSVDPRQFVNPSVHPRLSTAVGP